MTLTVKHDVHWTKSFPSGMWVASFLNPHTRAYVTRRFMGYTRRECERLMADVIRQVNRGERVE